MDFGALVVRDGDLVTASGRLVRDHAGAWFEPPAAMAAVAAAGGGPRMIRPVSRVAVRVAGAGFGELASRFEDGGAVEGFAALTGIWSAGQPPAGAGHGGVTQRGRPAACASTSVTCWRPGLRSRWPSSGRARTRRCSWSRQQTPMRSGPG
jgi:hypothetical protein